MRTFAGPDIRTQSAAEESLGHKLRRALGALLVLLLVLSLSLKMELMFGWSFDLAFAALVAFALILGGGELVALIGITLFVLRSAPGFTAELAILALTPILVALGARLLPWRSVLTPVAALLIGVPVFYAASGASIMENLWFLIGDILVCIAFAYILLGVFNKIWGKPKRGRMYT